MAELIPPDQNQRDMIVNRLDCNMLVEAAAGTGKTTSMVGRMLELIKSGKCKDISKMVAVTFTRKAAAELRSRFQIDLEQLVKKTEGEEKKRLNHALENLEQCFIGTIHSFCARLLRERPIEAGVNIGFIEIEEEADMLLREEAFDKFITSVLIDDPDELLADLDRYDLQISDLAETFKSFAEYPDIEEWPEAKSKLDLPELSETLKEVKDYIRHMEELKPLLPGNAGTDGLIPKYKSLPRIFSHHTDPNNPKQLISVLKNFDSNCKLTQKYWTENGNFTKEDAKAEKTRWDDFRENTVQPVLDRWLECCYSPVMKVLFSAQKIYERLRQEKGVLNFQDLLMKSANMLKNNPQVRKYFKNRFTHLLIDEFQDTDPIQAQVMMYLTATDVNQTSWRDCIPSPGSLFVVGDPKQSIYRFRRADIVTYKGIKEIIERSGGQIINLSTNFRTTGKIIDWVNSTFGPDMEDTEESLNAMLHFPIAETDHSPAYVAFELGRTEEDTGQLSGFYRLTVPSEYSNKESIIPYEADRIARTIRNAIDSKMTITRTAKEIEAGIPEYVREDDFMIITLRKKFLSIYARKLQEYGISNKVTGGSSLNEVDELRQLYLCLLTLHYPDNPVYLVGLLRSEMFGISDSCMYRYSKAGGRFSFYSDIPEALDNEVANLFADIFARLKTYSKWLSIFPVIAAVEKIIDDSGLMVSASNKPGGDIEAGGLAKGIEILRTMQKDTPTLSQLIERLGEMVEEKDKYDGISIKSEQKPAVRIMNLHKAKGLEAPIIFLADPSGENDFGSTFHIDRSGDLAKGYLAISLREGQYRTVPVAHPKNWKVLADREEKFEIAEKLRLRYVAATRAKSAVVVTQKSKRNNNNPWKYFDEYIGSKAEIIDPGPQRVPLVEERLILPEEIEYAEKSIQKTNDYIRRPTYNSFTAKDYAPEWMTKSGRFDATIDVNTANVIESFTIEGGQHGIEWGTAIHAILEYAMLNSELDLNGIAEEEMRKNELDSGLASSAVKLVKSVIQSNIWKRAMKSDNRFTEFPFEICLNESESNSLPTLIRGAIDMVFHEPDGWVVVDYKTDIVTSHTIQSAVKKYTPQVLLYADIWKQTLNEPVKESGLYFAVINDYLTVRFE